MRIGRLTLDGYHNYGNVLQLLALDMMLRRYGEVDSLWHSADNFLPLLRVTPKQELKNAIKYLINHKGYRDMCRSGYFHTEAVRQARIREFVLRHIHTVDMRGREGSIGAEYDYFVTGSDQVWNPRFLPDRCYKTFLMFAPKDKRISYAASISIPELPSEDAARFKKWASEMPYLSLREAAGAKMIADLTGREVPVHIDPTLVIDRAVYEGLEERPAWLGEEPYMVTYFLGDRPAAVERVARKLGLRVINILDREVFDHYIVSPEEFIYLIHHAELLYTDSFHGTVFAIQFRTPFVICERVQKDACTMTSRIDTLLALFGIESARGTAANDFEVEDPLTVDFSRVDDVLTRERARSYEYLDRAFGKSE